MKRRRFALDKWAGVRQQQELAEQRGHAAADPMVASVIRGKKALLPKRMMDEAGLHDTRLASEIATGFAICGPHTPAGDLPVSGCLMAAHWTANLAQASLSACHLTATCLMHRHGARMVESDADG